MKTLLTLIILIGINLNAISQSTSAFGTPVIVDEKIEDTFFGIIKSNMPAVVVFYEPYCPPCKTIYDKSFIDYLKQSDFNVYFYPIIDKKDNEYYQNKFKFQNAHYIVEEANRIFKYDNPNLEFPRVMVISSYGHFEIISPKRLHELKKSNELLNTLTILKTKKGDENFFDETRGNYLNKIELKTQLFDLDTMRPLISTIISKSTKTIGIRYELIIPNSITVSEVEFLGDINFNNFEYKEVAMGDLKIDDEKYKKKELRSVIIKTGVLSPKIKGFIKIEPLILQLNVGIPQDKIDVFGKKIYKKRKIQIKSENKSLTWF